MPGPNTTGLAQPTDYMIGRGRLFAAALDSVTQLPSGGWRDLGNAPDFKITTTVAVLDHMSSRSGLKTIDKEVVISQELQTAFTLEEINFENLTAYFSGTQLVATNGAVAGFTSYIMVANGTLALGRYYDVQSSTGVRCYDINAADLTITDTSGSPVSMVLNTDYTVEPDMGRIFVLSGSAKMITAVGASKGLTVTLAAKAGAAAVNEVRALTVTSVPVALKFIADDPVNNDILTEYQFNRVELKATSDFSLISDTFTQIQFQQKAEANSLLNPNSPTLTIRTVQKPGP